MSGSGLHPPTRLTLAILVGMLLVALQLLNVGGQTAYTVTITVQGLPTNLSTNVFLDGALNGTLSGGQSRSLTFSTSPTTHYVSVEFYVPNPSGSDGTRYYEGDASWAFNAGGSHVFTYTAQYYLTVETSFSVAKGEGWYDSGTSAQAILNEGQIEESAGVRHVFTGWGRDASGTGLTSNPILMDKPKKTTANWKTQFLLTVKSDPRNVTGLLGSSWYDTGSQANFSAPAISLADVNSRLRFDHWSGAYQGQSLSGTITMDQPKVVEAHYLAQYLLTLHYDPASIPHSYNETSWHDANTNVQLGPAQPTIELSSVERLRFVGWIENGKQLSGISLNLYMDKPHELTLSYMTQYYVTVRSSYGTVSGSDWYDRGSTARITAPSTVGYWPFTYTLSGWRLDPSTGSLTQEGGSWILKVDRPYVVEAVWSFDVFPIIALVGGSALAIVAAIGIALAYNRGMLTLWPPKPRALMRGPKQICGSCGNRIPKSATFCQKCGAPVVAAQSATLEDKVYDYIVNHNGVISLSKASEELGISVEQLKQSTEALKKKGQLA
jgi:hypothetical protein